MPITIKDVITGETREFSSIMATVKYLESINIKTDRNLISKHLDTGKVYKGYVYYKTKKP